MPIKAILFDKDGTLVDVRRTLTPAFEAVLRDLAAGDEGRFARLAEIAGFDPEAKVFLPHSPAVVETPSELAALFAPIVLGAPPDPAFVGRINALCVRETARFLTAAPGASAVVAGLKADGYRIGVSTNTSAEHARSELERLGILAHLDFLAGFNSGYGAKPDPGQALGFARAIDVAPADIVCVGDSVYDLTAARSAGAMAVGLLTDVESRDELAELAHYLVDSIEELPGLVARLRKAA